jgi:hypothetical protein|tara:strand:- start:103 stop:474 length:372 start_codon:yes stop_codon:yes gene_type:complete
MGFGTLKADTLTHSTEGSVSTEYVVGGSAKVACRINQSDSDGTFNHSFNASSITDGGTGKHTITFTSAMNDTNYAGSGCKSSTTYNYSLSITATNQFIMYNRNDSSSYSDSSQINGFAYGDLA